MKKRVDCLRKSKLAAALVMAAGCGMLTGCGVLNFSTVRTPGESYHVSVQSLPVYNAPSADSEVVADLKLGDYFVAEEVIMPQGHLLTDQADPWLRASVDGKSFYAPAGAVVSQDLWEAQLKGLPPRGEVKVKNFTSAKHQESDADLEQARDYRPGSLRLMLGAAGTTEAAAETACPEELTAYIKAQCGDIPAVELPKVESSGWSLPSLRTFAEIGPYQEFDLGAGLAAFMMPKALKPDHPATLYVGKVVDKLLKKSQLPQTYSGSAALTPSPFLWPRV